jgi:uncharacterized coiled-coil DUF342 family protein
MSDVDMSEEDANSPSNITSNSQQYLIDTIAQLEDRLQKALTSIDSYQNERSELLDTIIQLKSRSIELENALQNIVDIFEK